MLSKPLPEEEEEEEEELRDILKSIAIQVLRIVL